MKFLRTYKLSIEAAIGTDALGIAGSSAVAGERPTIEIDYPMTLRFEVSSTGTPSANTGRFLIYNLSEAHRKQIFKDQYDSTDYRKLVFQAGYQSEPTLPIVFQGNVYMASSYREGPDWITEVVAWDGGFGIEHGNINLTTPSPYELGIVLKQSLGTMPNVTIGAIGNIKNQNSRAITMCGNTWDITSRLAISAQARAFIHKEKIYVLEQNEYVSGDAVQVVSADTGMIGSPRIFSGQIIVSSIFEPKLEVGQIVQLQSRQVNNTYMVYGFTHAGMISGSKDADLRTTIIMFWGTEELVEVDQAA